LNNEAFNDEVRRNRIKATHDSTEQFGTGLTDGQTKTFINEIAGGNTARV